LALGQEWQQFTNAVSSAAHYAESAWSNLTSGIRNMSAAFSYYLFGKDPPEFIVMMDNFTAEQEYGFLESTYPLSSVIYENNSVILVLPGNLSGYVSIEVNESVGVNATYYNESSPQTPRVLTSFNAESGNAYNMYVRSNDTGKKALVAGYSLSFNHSEYSNVPWEIKISSSNGSIISEIESNSSEITFNNLPNGTYNFSLSPLNNSYRATPMTGEVSINGSNVNIGITFTLVTYTVTFTEKWLPSGTMWYVNLSNGQSFSSSTNTITFNEPNGTYSYTIATVNKSYSPSPSSGTFTVNGSNVNIGITFNLVTYTVTFTENGLPSGTTWYINLSNGQSYSGTGTTITFSEPNGTYSYTIATVNKSYAPSPSSGTFKVSGSNVNVGITFTLVTYTVTFTESGLPSGTMWYVNLSNGKSYSGTGTTITFYEPNGTYSYTIATVNKSYSPSPSSGTFTVSGANVNVAITFTLVTYTITFTENGLPSGTMWYVNLSNG
jgi:uncharacterized lipoprotein NlpE involved in copper resistance